MKNTALAAPLLSLLAVACGGGDSAPSGYDEPDGASPVEEDAQTSGDSGPNACAPSPAPDAITDVSGTWAFLEVAARLARAPSIVEPIPNQAVTVELLRAQQDGATVSVEGEYCAHWVRDPESQVHTLIPNAYTNALEPFEVAGTFEVDADGVGRLRLDERAEIRGAVLADPKNDPLPMDATDPAVIDQDGDGKPGVTVRITGLVTGAIYVVDKVVTRVDAVAIGDDRIAGPIHFDATEIILASDPPAIKDLSPTVLEDPDPCRSSVELVRLPDDADCAYIKDHLVELFPGSVAEEEVPR